MNTPVRPITIKFVFGKGLVKRRRESQNPGRYIAEQVLVKFVDDNWPQFKKELEAQIRSDVRMELAHIAIEFRKHVIGLEAEASSPTGTVSAVAKGPGRPSFSLDGAFAGDWLARSPSYLRYKMKKAGHKRWFDNRGFPGGGYLYKQFIGTREGLSGAQGQGGSFTFAGGVLEDIFGPVRVVVLKNNVLFGADSGFSVTNAEYKRSKVTVKVATVSVSALGSLTESMVQRHGTKNYALLGVIAEQDKELAYRLGGGPTGRYRPTLEPFLEFFLQKALPHAVNERLRKGTLGTSIIR